MRCGGETATLPLEIDYFYLETGAKLMETAKKLWKLTKSPWSLGHRQLDEGIHWGFPLDPTPWIKHIREYAIAYLAGVIYLIATASLIYTIFS